MDTQSKTTSVQILQGRNDLALVEWTEDKDRILRRSWVAQRKLLNITGRNAEVENPASGIPYGVEFWRLVEMKASSKDFDRELKNRGIWTTADARTRPNEVLGALVAAYGVDLTALFLALDEYEKALNTEA